MQKFSRLAPVRRPSVDLELHWHNVRDDRPTLTQADDDLDYFLRRPQAVAVPPQAPVPARSLADTLTHGLARSLTLAPAALATALMPAPGRPQAAHAPALAPSHALAAPFTR